ncbi:TetR/AcrR family transcriptional regulator C-terminal domain-containing protein [Nocardiopsis dassonvillei]|uniref:TetR/AcrR family transcriptional regulator C-terminal domain-containing protein n=1 Tax=Nocardiopsis dassonvillei TaxID=2014 RepID=UPI000B9D686F|nr:TetR/AcrR family transcriptional regulator C-terminal domain-containing protein [Nocardiopsis dassonvillei]ASU58202.1 TetR family transcriptional regulator [Nocardiopsis dassonvillei]
MPVKRTRGQRAGLTRQSILEAGLDLADREGLAALSMRNLGAELGVEAMTLYHYIPSKDALLDGIVECVVSEALPPRFAEASWQERLRGYANSLASVMAAHPNVVPLLMLQPAVTSRNMETMESMLQSLHSAGFDLRQAVDVIYTLTGFVLGHVAVQAGIQGVRSHGRPAEERERDIDEDRYPLLSRADKVSERDARFEFALDALITGFEAACSAPRS